MNRYKSGSPMQPDLIWIDTSITNFAKEISDLGIDCSYYIAKQLLKDNKLGIRKISRSISLNTVENSNEQYLNTQSLTKQYIENGNPVISVDVKKKEMIGNFYRDGKCYCNESYKVYDHDFNSFSKGTIVPHGIYDLNKNVGYITLSESKDTCEFNCDCIKNWWINYGKYDYPNATSILILCDGGGSNLSRGYLFKEHLQNLSNDINIELRISHFPPYKSKHNPIEHRLFSYISKQLNGFQIVGIKEFGERISKTVTETGLKVIVNISNKIYAVGKKVSEKFRENCPILFDDYLGKWNYTAVPVNR